MQLNENIRNFRKFRNLTQAELGELISRSKSVISHWENGENTPDPDSCEKLCKALKVTPNELFGWEENKAYIEHEKKLKQLRAQIEELQERKDDIDKQITNLEILMMQEENPLLDIEIEEE